MGKWPNQRNLLTLEISPKLNNVKAERLLSILKKKLGKNNENRAELIEIFEQFGKREIRENVSGQVSYYGKWNPTPIFPDGNSEFYDSVRVVINATRGPVELKSLPLIIFIAERFESEIKSGGKGFLTVAGNDIRLELARVATLRALIAERYNNAYNSEEAHKQFMKIADLNIDFDKINPSDRNRLQFAIFRTQLDISLHRFDWDKATEAIGILNQVKPEYIGPGLEKYRRYWLSAGVALIYTMRESKKGLPPLEEMQEMWKQLVRDDSDVARNPMATPAHLLFE